MAETFISPVIEKLVGLLDEEIKSLKGVHGEVRSLKDELQIIQPLLREAEAKSEKEVVSDPVREWLKQIREEAGRMEDLIDNYRYHLGQRRSWSGFTSFLFKAWHFIKALKPRHEIAAEIRTIKQSLTEIKSRGRDYGLTPLEHGPSHGTTDFQAPDPRMQSLFLEKDELVGIERHSTDLIAKLVGGASSRLIIALVGEGGIGKTTLAKKVYDDEVVKTHFESASAWITVSNPYNPMKVLNEMKKQICKLGDCIEGETDTIEGLIGCLKTYLQTKRYMIFLDDVWEENFWDNIKHAFPNNNEGSRIIITTRNTAVANSCKETSYDLYEFPLSRWSSTLAWELFCKKAFKEFQGNCPPELEQLSIKIIMKCHGLPLAVATIASLLATKDKVESAWKRVLDDLSSKVEMDSQFPKIQQILSLSYYDLPYYLRSCFTYFGVFPEDYSILDERLFRLWIADGLVKEKGKRTLEEVAEENLFELIKRNLVSSYPRVGEGNFFRVHDLMRDVILSRVDDVCFCQTRDEKKKRCRGKGRRLMITGSTKDVLEKIESSGVRSIFLFDVDDQLTESFMMGLFKKFKLLEVLDVENAPVDTLPKELGKLFCLKYLSLRNTRVKVLPKSIGKLHNLESLDVRDSSICKLPKEINMLTKLRHLLAYRYHYNAQNSFDYVHGVAINEGIGQLQDLQSLTLVEANIVGVSLMKELEKLTKLMWLGISKLNKEICRALCTSIGKMDHLKGLYLRSVDENEVLDLHYISSPPHFLHELLLCGQLGKLPEWILKLQNLRGLSLSCTRLIDELGKCLKGLPNLESLSIIDEAYEGERLYFEKHGFPKLKSLGLKQLSKLKLVEVDTGALPVLERLIISQCLLLKEVPPIRHLANLKYAVFNGTRVN